MYVHQKIYLCDVISNFKSCRLEGGEPLLFLSSYDREENAVEGERDWGTLVIMNAAHDFTNEIDFRLQGRSHTDSCEENGGPPKIIFPKELGTRPSLW